MKQVKLYSLKEHIVTVSGDYIPYMSHNNKPSYISDSNEFVFDVPVEVQHIKIEKVVNDGEEYLVAFDPKIRKLLGINEKQLKDELSEVKKQRDLFERHNARLKKGNIEIFHRLEVQYNQLCMFTTMSFWKRLVFLFTGKV